jgi:hypothetical protein
MCRQIRAMTTINCFHRLSRSTVHACLLCAVTFWGTCPRASAANALQRSQSHALATQGFFCRVGYDPHECQRRIAQLKTVLIHYPVAPKHWRWVIVPSEHWQPLVQSLHLDRESPAFTAITERETFLEDALFFAQPGRSDELVRRFRTPFDQLLSVAVSHELGHAICHGGSEAIANRVAEQLRGGKYPDCAGNVKSLTPIEELYLHGQSASFPRL